MAVLSLILLLLLFLLLLVQSTFAQLYVDNEVLGDPKIKCESNMLSISFVTKSPFQGHVFIRGHYVDDECHKDYIRNRDTSGFMDVQFSDCGMRRKRMANPRGMMMTSVVIVSFHRTFITYNDQAYSVECFYLEDQKVVQSDLIVSPLSTTDLSMHPPMPTCTYSVLDGGPQGETMKFAKVGDVIFHEWTCNYSMPNMYCMVIHNCNVDDGETALYQVVDDRGCSKDPVILSQVEYTSDLNAGAQAHAFKFADRAHVYFTCQVKLSLKNEHQQGVCPRPECDSARFRRFRQRRSSLDILGENFDLLAEPITVADLEDTASSVGAKRSTTRHLGTRSDESAVCLSEITFGLLVSIVLLSTFTVVLFVIFHFAHSRQNVQKSN